MLFMKATLGSWSAATANMVEFGAANYTKTTGVRLPIYYLSYPEVILRFREICLVH